MKFLKYPISGILFFNLLSGLICASSGDQVIANLAKKIEPFRDYPSQTLCNDLKKTTSKNISVLEQMTGDPKLSTIFKRLIAYEEGTPQVLQQLINMTLCFKSHETAFKFYQELAKHQSPKTMAKYLETADLTVPQVNPNVLSKLQNNVLEFKRALQKNSATLSK